MAESAASAGSFSFFSVAIQTPRTHGFGTHAPKTQLPVYHSSLKSGTLLRKERGTPPPGNINRMVTATGPVGTPIVPGSGRNREPGSDRPADTMWIAGVSGG